MNKYVSRITSSARGETFNPLTWPFLLATLSFGIGFTFFFWTEAVQDSSLFKSMHELYPWTYMVWGITAIITVFTGMTFLAFNIPPIGKLSGLIGFMLWVFAGFAWWQSGGLILVFAVSLPNAWFWFWQYLSLSHFRKEDSDDHETLLSYDKGEYDDEENPKDARRDRENNRGMDRQSAGSYDEPDNGGDASRCCIDSQ